MIMKKMMLGLKKWLVTGGIAAMTVTAPLGTDTDTIAYWTFDEAGGAVVSDSVTTPSAVNGTATGTAISPAVDSGLPAAFVNSRDFSPVGSYVNFGPVSGTKVDMQGRTAASVEAVIVLGAAAPDIYTIFDNRQLQLQVINNRIAGFVRQTGGFKGAVGESLQLQQGVPYRVGLSISGGYLVVFAGGRNVGTVKIDEPVAAAEQGTNLYVGGAEGGMNFPGKIDDVRLSGVARVDTLPPVISLVTPDAAMPVYDSKPVITVAYSDNNAIDPASVKLFLNGRRQYASQDLLITGTNIQGRPNDFLVGGQQNVINVEVADTAGNVARAEYKLLFINRADGDEYVPDADTVALWHFDELSPKKVLDSSANKFHGKVLAAEIGQGVFGLGRYFTSGNGSKIIIPYVPVSGRKFTFEAWVLPHSIASSYEEQYLFYNGQIYVSRISEGNVRVRLRMAKNDFTVESTDPVLPTGQRHHLKIAYDGSISTGGTNLVIQIDGVTVNGFAVNAFCDFSDEPVLGVIGQKFNGMLDEIRLSSIVREQVNIFAGQSPSVTIALPLNDGTVRTPKPALHALYEAIGGIAPENVFVWLNGVRQQPSQDLQITQSGIDGTLADSMLPGRNRLEIGVKDNKGNMTKVISQVFYIHDGGSMEYVTDADTVGLWHLNSDFASEINDSSPNAYSGEAPGAAVSAGVFGHGRTMEGGNISFQNVSLPGRAFTVENWMQFNGTGAATIWSISGQSFSFFATRQSGGTLAISLQLPTGDYISSTVPNLLPANELHHLAVVYDGNADYSNLLFLVDGAVKYKKNLKAACDNCFSNVSFTAGSGYLDIDEIRLSKTARYSINAGSNISKPAIGHISPVPYGTVLVPMPVVDYVFDDPDGINASQVVLLVNGQSASGPVVTVSGSRGRLYGALTSPLSGGANLFEIRVKDLLGNEAVETFEVFLIAKGPPAAYPDSDTGNLALWHFNETGPASVFQDSSGNGRDWTSYSAIASEAGVFGNAAQLKTYEMLQAQSFPVLGNKITWESWVKADNVASGYVFYSSLFDVVLEDNGNIKMRFNVDIGYFEHSFAFPSDGAYHHVAVIYDGDNPLVNCMFLLDGMIRFGGVYKLQAFPGSALSNLQIYPYGAVSIDEMRISQAARYELNYSTSRNGGSASRSSGVKGRLRTKPKPARLF